jgi:hypothetical protein
MQHVPQRAARTTRDRPAKNTDTAQPAKATAKVPVTKASKVLLNSHLSTAPRKAPGLVHAFLFYLVTYACS